MDSGRRWLHGLPDIDEGVPHHEYRIAIARGRVGRDARLLGAGHQMVSEHTDASARRRITVGEDFQEVVETVQHLDDDTFHSQVVSPDLLD